MAESDFVWIEGRPVTLESEPDSGAYLQEWKDQFAATRAFVRRDGSAYFYFSDPGNVGMTIKAADEDQSANLMEFRDDVDNLLAAVNPDGTIAITPASDVVGLTVKAAPVQTVPLQQWQNDAGAPVASIDKTGLALVNNITASGIIGASDFVAFGTSEKGLEVVKNLNAPVLALEARNTNSGDSAYVQARLQSSSSLYLRMYSENYNQADARANTAAIETDSPNGLGVFTTNNAGSIRFYPANFGKAMEIAPNGNVEIVGRLVHQGNQVGFYNTSPVARQTWETPSIDISRDTFDPGTVGLPNLARRVAAIITDLRAVGLFG
jgi:hypothetical protein